MHSKHHIISPYSPAVNGIIERVHRCIGDYIQSFCEEQTTDWVEFLPALTFSLNTRVHAATKLSPFFITYGQHPVFPWTPEDNITYSESEITDRVRMLQYAQRLCYNNDLDARAASKRSFDIKAKFRQFKIKDEVLLYFPSPPKGQNKKFYIPWRGIYEIVERTSPLTYLVKKKGGRNRRAHVNRLKFYDPKNSHEDPTVKISIEEDKEDNPDDIITIPNDLQERNEDTTKNYSGRITRSKTNSLPQRISRYSAASKDETEKLLNQSWAPSQLKQSLRKVNILQ